MAREERIVSVWLDSTSDKRSWVVDVCIEEDGETLTSDTLSTHASEDEALRAGAMESHRRGLPLYRIGAGGRRQSCLDPTGAAPVRVRG